MLDAQDIQKLVEVLASKTNVVTLEERISVIETRQDRVIEILDKMVSRITLTP